MDMIWMILLVILGLIVLLTLLWLFCLAPATPRGDFSALKRYDYAHRGLHEADGSVPENSLAGFRAAVKAGYGIEWDVQLTKDKKVVIHHDRSLKRLCGADVSIGDLTYKELQQYRLLNTDERVPLFSEALQVVGGKTPLIIELKGYTSSGIALTACRVISSVLFDAHAVLPLSVIPDGEYGLRDVALSLPCVLGERGIEHILTMPLDEDAERGMRACDEYLRSVLHNIDFASGSTREAGWLGGFPPQHVNPACIGKPVS